MLDSMEIGRIADAVVAVRSDWPVGQVADYLEENHKHRGFKELAAAAVYVAADPNAVNLAFLDIDGPWWITMPETPAGYEPIERKHGPKRDEKWWSLFELAKAQRTIAFGYPKPAAPEVAE